MIGNKDLPDRMEKVGRYGEKIILEATAMGFIEKKDIRFFQKQTSQRQSGSLSAT